MYYGRYLNDSGKSRNISIEGFCYFYSFSLKTRITRLYQYNQLGFTFYSNAAKYAPGAGSSAWNVR